MPSRVLTFPAAARALLLVAPLALACTGSVGDGAPGTRPGTGSPSSPSTGGPSTGGGNPSTGGGNGGGTTTPVPPPERPGTGACKTLDPGPSPLRLLTRNEYASTVRDLFGNPPAVLSDLSEDGRPARGYANDAYARSASDAMVAGFMKAAEKLAAAAVADVPKLAGCDPASGEQACFGKFLDSFAKRAWRRPLTPAERTNVTAAFTEGKASGKSKSFADGLEAAVTMLLMSPQFLYRYEQGIPITGNDKVAQLTSWEVASRLSYLLWGTMPDSALMDAAEANKLSRPAEVMEQARRMVKDPRFMETVTEFGEQYLNLDQMPTLDKDPQTLPAWKPELREAMRLEGRKFLEHVLTEGEGKLATFLTAPYTMANGPLAAYYGVQGVTGDQFRKVDLDPSKYAGFLTQSGFLSVHGTPDKGLTSLVFRGIFVRESLLCQPIPDPPPNAQDENPPFTPTTTPRQWSMARMAKPVCGSCHTKTDPVGFVFEGFDAIGRPQTEDSSGSLDNSDIDGNYVGVPALAKKLATSKMVSDCMAANWFRFASGRAETERDSCSLGTLQDAFNKSSGDLRELFVAYVSTDAFLFRSKGDAP
jgi:hypothetical protein